MKRRWISLPPRRLRSWPAWENSSTIANTGSGEPGTCRVFASFCREAAATLDKLAVEFHGVACVQCENDMRRDVVLNRVSPPRDKFRRIYQSLFQPRLTRIQLAFESEFIAQTTKLFAKTDAFVLIGYDFWPAARTR